uniref:Macroglobulin domain-containing protein n=1 Tax=Anopheles culicifacies TaxID=139723 RepID=A0A182M1V4_9DIPT
MLFNNLETAHIEEVTLYNVDSQTKLVGQSLEDLLDYILCQQKEFEMYDATQVELRYERLFEMDDDQQSNRTVMKESQITVHKRVYNVELIRESPQFRSGLPFKCVFQFRYHDGRPAEGVAGKVEVLDIDYETTATSDNGGFIRLKLNPNDNIDSKYITCYLKLVHEHSGVQLSCEPLSNYITFRMKDLYLNVSNPCRRLQSNRVARLEDELVDLN